MAETRGSVFSVGTNSVVASPPMHVKQKKEPITFEEKAKPKVKVQATKAKKPNAPKLQLDIEAIEKEHNRKAS